MDKLQKSIIRARVYKNRDVRNMKKFMKISEEYELYEKVINDWENLIKRMENQREINKFEEVLNGTDKFDK